MSIEKSPDDGQAASPETSLRNEEEIQREIHILRRLHRFDPNLDASITERLEKRDGIRDTKSDLELIDLIESDSPYEEVRAAVRNCDNDLPCNTVRAWTLGLLLVTVGSAMNMLFSMRYPTISITAFVAQLIAYPLGIGWDRVMPKKLIDGPFNYKEHALITIMASVSFAQGGYAYSTDTIIAMKGFYGVDFGWGFQFLTTFGTQMIGFGIAGIMRKFLVWPAAMMWPSNFVNTSLFYALHDHSNTDPSRAGGWSISRFKYFWIIFGCSFVWYWFPGWIFQALSYFAFATWIAPNNTVVNQLFGYTTGLGLIPVTFDWAMITGFNLSPLMYPWHGIANTLVGLLVFFAIGCTALHYSNWGYADYLLMSSSNAYDNTGALYNVSRILTENFTLDEQQYQEYSPLFLPTTFSMAYGLSFATVLALITHTAIFHGQEIWTRASLAFGDELDIHTKLMKKYREVPTGWYVALFLVMLGLSLASVLAYGTDLPWWAFFVALAIASVFVIPIGMIQATTNVQIGLNVITEFIIGYMHPGRPIGMMLFKTYGYITMSQALTFCQDLKLGHYMKIPPRTVFWGQVISTLWSCIVQIGVLNWTFANVENICDPENEYHFTCPNGRVFFTASVIWGLIGPARIFGPGGIYHSLLYFFIAGLLVPPFFYVLARMFPPSSLRYVNVPLIFGGAGNLPPATMLNYSSWAIVGFIFNKVIKNRSRGWWSNYNYLTSAGLDCGLAVCTIVIFLCLQLPNLSAPSWWGNTVVSSTSDAQGTAVLKTVAEGQIFGPPVW